MLRQIDIFKEFRTACSAFEMALQPNLEALEVSVEGWLRAAGIGAANIITTGRTFRPHAEGIPAIIVGEWRPGPPSVHHFVEEPNLIDLVAFLPEDPDQFWFRIGKFRCCLGGHEWVEAAEAGCPIPLFLDPLSWLRADCRGACVPEFDTYRIAA